MHNVYEPDKATCVYDAVFAEEDDFDPKLHRSDRHHDKLLGLHTNDEEITKAVPSLSSSVYGHRLANELEFKDRSHVRTMLVQTEFFRRNGIDI
ncbi:hypothetical protein FBUS_01856 [Fasciolopsis buskii]|uniref:Uncharacterized protein n=1 Tax=Fasciolopsis buskii TaxID=27845 RepID=A0A8E0RQR8_9TREM|nr:hypothetical protein FBUS_01856 [Fasciolopsis buski]